MFTVITTIYRTVMDHSYLPSHDLRVIPSVDSPIETEPGHHIVTMHTRRLPPQRLRETHRGP